jgi:D-arabinose 1-dehydrogenase-like Zn-dependent alcohol dehydrogenase
VPGHEIVGIVEELGADVVRLKKGDRVGVGWHGGHCAECDSCRKGDFITCRNLETPGITRDGGYAEYGLFPENVCAMVPPELSSAEAAPLLCAGVTTYNALRHAGAMAGDVVAILGIGGLGHLGVMFANKMGYNTVAIARGKDKAAFATKIGAHHYIDSENPDAVDQLNKLGGAKVILSTITNSKAMSPWVNGLCIGGRMVLVGADFQPMEVSPVALLAGRRSLTGWPSGTARDSEDCLKFAALSGIRPMIETFPLNKAEQAIEHMLSGKARFRAVIEVSK